MPEPQPPARRSFLQKMLGLKAAAEPTPSTAVAVQAPPPTPPSEVKAFPATGVHFVGPAMVNSRLHWISEGGINPDADKLTRHLAFLTSAYCYTAMDWRARRLAEAPMMVVRETKAGEEWQPNHPLENLLDQPRPDVTMGEILTRTRLYWDLTGACLWVIDRNAQGDRAMLTPFAQGEFKSEALGDLIYGAYSVRTKGGTWKPVGPDAGQDLVHFRDVDPTSWRCAASRVDVALAQLSLGHTVNRIVKNFLNKAMFPGGILSPNPEWHPTPGEWEIWKDLVKAWQAGPANAGEPLALPGGTTFSAVAASLTDMLPDDVLDRVEATVGSVFGTPPVVLGWKVGLENSPWSNYGEARRAAYEDTIEPMWRDVGNTVGRALLTPEERRGGGLGVVFDTGKVRALQPDREVNSRISTLNVDTWTVKERRIFTGQEPLGDERDDIIVGLQPAPAPPDSVGQGDGDTAAGKASLIDARGLTWLLFDLDTKAAEPGWERVVYGQLQLQRAEIVQAAQTHLKDVAAPSKADTHEFEHHLQRILAEGRTNMVATTYPLLVTTGGKAVRRLSARVGLSFQVLEPGLLKYAHEEAAFLARVMGETTGTAVAAAVQAGLAEGETVGGLVKRLEELPAFDRGRARLTARTETTRAWNGAQRRSLSEFRRATGRSVQKTWLNSQDDRVRDEHQDQEQGGVGGETVEINQQFSNGLMEPGEPNCFPAGTLVQGRFVAGLRAQYAGEVVVLRTAGGRELTVTPNHPILTPRGFVAAGRLAEGDEVLGYTPQRRRGSEPGEHDEPTAIEKVFDALSQDAARVTRQPRPEALHGDAAFVQGNIEVVRPYRALLRDDDAEGYQLARQVGLVPADVQTPALARRRSLSLASDGIDGPAPSGVGLADLGGDSRGTSVLDPPPFEPLRVGSAAELDASRYEPTGEERPVVAGLVADLLERSAGQVTPDQVREIRHEHYDGHVYDLEASTGVMIAGGLVTSNCRCTLTYAVGQPDGTETDVEETP